MWAKLNPQGTLIEEIIAHPKSIEVYGIKYPRQIFKWSAEMLKEIHIVPVVTEGQPLDTKYYIEANASYTIAPDENSVVKTIGVLSGTRNIDDVAAVDVETGDPLLNKRGDQVITKGLKSNALGVINTQAYSYMRGFDWLQIRKGATTTPVPEIVTTYLQAVRDAHASIQTAIEACTTTEEFQALYIDVSDGEGEVTTIAKINDWPDDYAIDSMRRG